MFTILIFIAVLAALVLSHEFGHFIMARRAGIKVEEFGFGFPPRLAGIHRSVSGSGQKRWHVVWGSRPVKAEVEAATDEPAGTVYSINWLPLGGFVKIKGEGGEAPADPDSFANKTVGQRVLVLVAGVAMNVVLAAALLSVSFMVGTATVATTESGQTLGPAQLQIMQVLPGTPADRAGLTPGDVILAIGSLQDPRLKPLQDYVQAHRNELIILTIERSGGRFEQTLRPAIHPSTGRAILGVGLAEVSIVRYPWYEAIYRGVVATGVYLKELVIGLGLLIKNLFTDASVSGTVAGPVGVAVMTGQAARLGVSYFIQFMAVLSLNLAVLNILPIPALDGGRLLFLILNKLLRRPIALKYEHLVHAVGFALLLVLIAAVTFKDVWGLFGANR